MGELLELAPSSWITNSSFPGSLRRLRGMRAEALALPRARAPPGGTSREQDAGGLRDSRVLPALLSARGARSREVILSNINPGVRAPT